MKTQVNAQDNIRERQLDAALSAYPLAPLPADFTSRLMVQVALTPQTPYAATPLVTHADLLRRYLRLYSFELVASMLLTLGLALGIVWPLFAQAGLLPALWSNRAAIDVQLETIFAHYVSSWYTLVIGCVILLELGGALLVWVAWMEPPPRLKVR